MLVVTEFNAIREHLLVCGSGCGHVVGCEHGGESSRSCVARYTETIGREPRFVAALDAGGNRGVT
jgi:hypothetical protein